MPRKTRDELKVRPPSRRNRERPSLQAVSIPTGQLNWLIDRSSRTNVIHLYQGMCTVDLIGDIANFKANIVIPALNILVTGRQIDKWNSTQQDQFADLVAYGTQLLIELKLQTIMREYCPSITKADATPGEPFNSYVIAGLMSVLPMYKIPDVCYVLADFYTPVFQMLGYMRNTSRMGLFFTPFAPSMDYDDIESLLASIAGLYDGVVYATQGQIPLKPIDLHWLSVINEYTPFSDLGFMYCTYWPINYDNGGAETETYIEVDETTDIYFSAQLGVPEFYDAAALLRSVSCADNPTFLTVSSIANDKMSIRYAGPSSTTWTEIGKAENVFDWIRTVATARGATNMGLVNTVIPFGEFVSNVFNDAGPSTWDLLAAQFLARHMMGQPIVVRELGSVLPDMMGSFRRRSSGGESPSPSPGSGYNIPGSIEPNGSEGVGGTRTWTSARGTVYAMALHPTSGQSLFYNVITGQAQNDPNVVNALNRYWNEGRFQPSGQTYNYNWGY